PRRPGHRHAAPAPVVAAPVAADGPLLQVRGLEISYGRPDDPTRVVHGIDLTVDAGETVGLVGESGSGKTATARAILGILRGGRITGGRVVLDGADITGIGDFSPAQRTRLGIGYIAQEPHLALDPNWTVGGQLVEALRHVRPTLSKADAREKALDLLRSVRLRDVETVMRKYPFELSGGMAQRVVIARALCEDPKLLVADEPTTALDVTVQAEILDLLRDIQRRTGMAVLIITHDWGVVADLCTKAVVMRHGVVREEASVADIFAHPGDDYTAALLASNPAMMASRGQLPTTDLLEEGRR
ncbi:MAG: ABC transporter ATP-binding protein, partial [Microbacterium sp.]|uniref:ABC transporter ATP-binding protein n=1 Tax=Microbacterium sp. TaxID=51671 RepID=UPI0039E2B5A1